MWKAFKNVEHDYPEVFTSLLYFTQYLSSLSLFAMYHLAIGQVVSLHFIYHLKVAIEVISLAVFRNLF